MSPAKKPASKPQTKSKPVSKAALKDKSVTSKGSTSAKGTNAPAKGGTKSSNANVSTSGAANKSRAIIKPKNAAGGYSQGEFLDMMQGFCGLEKRSHAKVLSEDICALVLEALKKGYKIPFFGLGKLSITTSKKRKGRNPRTGEVIDIPAKKRVKLSIAKALKEEVL
jgi:DNA-binding protein HU-beta